MRLYSMKFDGKLGKNYVPCVACGWRDSTCMGEFHEEKDGAVTLMRLCNTCVTDARDGKLPVQVKSKAKVDVYA